MQNIFCKKILFAIAINFLFLHVFALAQSKQMRAMPQTSTIKQSGFVAGYMDEKCYLISTNDFLRIVPTVQNVDQHYDLALKDVLDRFEVRYITFIKQGFISNEKKALETLARIVAENIAGNKNAIKSTKAHDAKAAKFFHLADAGVVVHIQNPTSQFATGYKYIQAQFFYKKNYGVMAQIFLYNKSSTLRSLEFTKARESFTFLH